MYNLGAAAACSFAAYQSAPSGEDAVRSTVTRRAIAYRIAGAVAVVSGIWGSSRAQDSAQISYRWRVPTAQIQIVKDSLRFSGQPETEKDQKGLPLVAIFAGVTLLPSLVDAILSVRQRLVQPGLKIDARGAEITIDIDPDLPHGTILLVDKSGSKIYEPRQPPTSADLIKALANAQTK